MNQKILELTKKLVAIPSTENNPQALEEVLGVAQQALSNFTVERFEKNGSHSFLAYVGDHRPEKFHMMLNGHLDIVPGKSTGYQPKVDGDRLYGVGALDMKASVSCLLAVFVELASKVAYPLGLQLVTDEEVGGFNGTKHQIEQGVIADFVIAAEPTNLDIVHQAKGILQLKITASGQTAHGAYTWRGENAIWKMETLLQRLKKEFPIPKTEVWATTLNLSRIETSNFSLNKIPDDCSIWIDIRFIPEDEKNILSRIKTLLSDDFELSVLVQEPALFVDPNNAFVRDLTHCIEKVTHKNVRLYGANGSSDARHYTRVGTNGVEFGPVGANIGGDDEWVSLESLDAYCEILKKFLLKR